jgi:hypothetical protein
METQDGVEMWRTCGACPVQYEGTVDGVPFYFRARGQHWTFGAGGETAGDAVEISMGYREDGFRLEEPWGEEMYDAGWMDHADAEAIIARCIQEFRAARAAPTRTEG